MAIVPHTLTSAVPLVQLKVLIRERARYCRALRGSQAVGLTEMPLGVGQEGDLTPGSGWSRLLGFKPGSAAQAV